MELWIRSQQKTNLYKIDNINMDDNDYTLYYQLSWGQIELGTYKSKERALEVLDEIQNILKPVIITTEYECDIKDNLRDKTHFNLEMKPKKTEIQQITSYVYEMPEE
jgi:hypothetical protein